MSLRHLSALLPALCFACTEYDLQPHKGNSSAGEDTGSDPSDQGEGSPDSDDLASLKGRVCDPSGGLWVVGAVAWVAVDLDGDGDEERVESVTDEEGYFLLEGLPLGTHTVHVDKGSFSTSFEVSLEEPGLTELTEEECLSPESVEIAVVSGAYDSIGSLLLDMGLEFDTFNGTSGRAYLDDLLLDPEKMAEYDIIFINCGVSDDWAVGSTAGTVGSNIREFVQNGGSIYASDWAHFMFEKGFPDSVDFYGEDSDIWAARVGYPGRITATVVDPVMEDVLGSGTARLNYDLDAWVVPEEVGSETEVLVQGTADTIWWDTVTNAPLAVRTHLGEGTALYTSFHNESQATEDMEAILNEIILSL